MWRHLLGLVALVMVTGCALADSATADSSAQPSIQPVGLVSYFYSLYNSYTRQSDTNGVVQGIDSGLFQKLTILLRTWGFSTAGITEADAFRPISSQALSPAAMDLAMQQAQSLNFDPNWLASLSKINDQMKRNELFDAYVRAQPKPLDLTARYNLNAQLQQLIPEELEARFAALMASRAQVSNPTSPGTVSTKPAVPSDF